MDEKSLGLRERKRIETRNELEAATITLVMRDGLEQTTIEAISERANVSPRTFFNYFDSKEEAILGLHDIDIDDATITRHIATYSGVSTIESIVSLMVDAIGPALTDPALYKSRMQIIRQHPQLLERQITRIAHVSKQFTYAIQQVGSAGHDMQINEAQAEVLLALCMSSIRVSIRQWVTTGKKVVLSKLKQQAIQTVNEIINKT